MKKEEERKEKDRNQEDKVSGSDTGEFGIEYDFFITEDTKTRENILYGSGAREPIKREDNTDQSKTFFLPDFFSDED